MPTILPLHPDLPERPIRRVLADFLKDAEAHFSKKSAKTYASVMNLFMSYLNNYAYESLPREDRERFDRLYDKGHPFCDVFEIGYAPSEIGPFIAHTRHKVLSPEAFTKQALPVMKSFVKWLERNEFVPTGEIADARERLSEYGAKHTSTDKVIRRFEKYCHNHLASFPDAEIVDEDYGHFNIKAIKSTTLILDSFDALQDGERSFTLDAALAKEMTQLVGSSVFLNLVLQKRHGKNVWRVESVGTFDI